MVVVASTKRALLSGDSLEIPQNIAHEQSRRGYHDELLIIAYWMHCI